MKKIRRGIDRHQELDPRTLLRDTRTIWQRIGEMFSTPSSVAIWLAGTAAVIQLFPGAFDLVFLGALGLFTFGMTRRLHLPFRMPMHSHTKDYNDLKPSSTEANMARGIAIFGNELGNNEELWFNNEDMRTHVLIFGSTGSGKTVALVSLAYNALIQGSGFIYVDGKGDNSLYANIFSLTRSVGREDDLLLINFMTGAKDIMGPQEKRLSNTLNPFSSGSSSMLSQLVVSLMDSSGQSSDGDMWKGRAINFVESLMKVLVYMRDQGHILLDANSIRNYFLFPKLEAMVMDHQFLRDGQEPISLDSAPEVVLEPIKSYVWNLPGFSAERKGKQVSQVLEQHGFITMQLVRVFSSLADTYGHIIRTNLAEVDFEDVVLNRRILVVLLPALEKSPPELANLGKITVASLKAMMARGLGEGVEGMYHDVIERKPTNAPSPYLCILDEYGYYAVEGFAVVPAQARSLGFSAIFAGQDLPAFQKASKEEAASIGANTNIKICMKLEDPTETWEFFTKTAGEAYVTKVDSFQTKETSLTNSYLDSKSSSFEKRARIDLMDLKGQGLGEAHIFFTDKIVRAKMFYANPKPVKEIRINHFLKVGKPLDKILSDLDARLLRFKELAEKSEIFVNQNISNEDIVKITRLLAQQTIEDPIERSVSALMLFHGGVEKPIEVDEERELESADKLSLFTKLRTHLVGLNELLADEEGFGEPILLSSKVWADINTLERLSGREERHANGIASEIVKDMRVATIYPPDQQDFIKPTQLKAIVSELCDRLREGKEKEESVE